MSLSRPAAAGAATASAAPQPGDPWYRRVRRWGQTNITERDPVRYDIPWWREYWKRTAVQGVIVNAGGIVAYYPSKFPLHHRAEFLNGRDLYGELAHAAHEDGLAVLARMDSNRTAEDFFQAHPDWFARDASGEPYRADDKYVTCVNSPYYDEYIPGILREIVERSHPEGFARQQLERPRPRQHLLLRKLRAQVPRPRPASRCPRARTGTTRPTGSGSSGTTRAAWRSGIFSTTAPPKRRAGPIASVWG